MISLFFLKSQVKNLANHEFTRFKGIFVISQIVQLKEFNQTNLQLNCVLKYKFYEVNLTVNNKSS